MHPDGEGGRPGTRFQVWFMMRADPRWSPGELPGTMWRGGVTVADPCSYSSLRCGPLRRGEASAPNVGPVPSLWVRAAQTAILVVSGWEGALRCPESAGRAPHAENPLAGATPTTRNQAP